MAHYPWLVVVLLGAAPGASTQGVICTLAGTDGLFPSGLIPVFQVNRMVRDG